MNKNIFAIIILILIATVGGYFLIKKQTKGNPDDGSQIACPQDAKACPDGSYVSRTGPNCAFAACPEKKANDEKPAIDTSDWKTYRNEEYGFEVRYPSDWYKFEDSQGIQLSSMSPDDPEQHSSNGLISTLTISYKDKQINEVTATFQNENGLVKKDITLSGNLKAFEITFVGAYGGEIHLITLVPIEDGTLQIHYVHNSLYQAIFRNILSTFRFIK